MKKNKIKIFIPIEKKSREFDGKLLLTSILIKYGFEIFIGSKGAINRECVHYKNSIYIAKSLSKAGIGMYETLKANNSILINLDVEGGVYSIDMKEQIATRYDKKIIKYLDFAFLYGDSIKKFIADELGYLDKRKLGVTGDPRFDLLKAKFKSFWNDDLAYIKKNHGNFILINTNFGLANHRMGQDKLRKYYRNTLDIPEEKRTLYFNKMDERKITLDSFVKAIQEVVSYFKELKFILRPHPDEDVNYYRNKFKNKTNIVIKNEGNVQKWILASSAVIHNDCTTGIEAIIADKPTISFCPQNDDSTIAWLPIFVSKVTKTNKELISAIQEIRNKNYANIYPLSKEKAGLLNSYIFNYCNESSELIAKTLIDKTATFENSKVYSKPILYLKRIRFFLAYYKRKIQGIKVQKPQINREELENKLEKLIMINDTSIKFKIRVIDRNVACISAER